MNDGADRDGPSIATIAALIFVWFAATAWARPLMLPDEGRYVGVAWEMLRSGDWLTPTLNGLPYFHKPPLFYWITAASLGVLGNHEGAARVAPILGAWLGAFAFYRFVRRWRGEGIAQPALLVLLVQPLFFLAGQFANLDMLVAGFITATIVLLADAALGFEAGLAYRGALTAAYAMAAGGVLAKGLIGLVLPALVVGAWLSSMRRWRTLAALCWWPGPVVFALLAVPWFVAMGLRFPGFLDYFVVEQHVRRFASGGFNNVQPFWFYPAVLLLFSLPWLAWLARPFERGYFADAERGPVRLLMVLWMVVVVVFFSLPRSKLLGYVLPAVPPLAFLIAEGYASLAATSKRATRRWQRAAGFAVVVDLATVAVLATISLPSSRAFATVLNAQRGSAEPLYMLADYAFDLPFYAALAGPVVVVDDWTTVEIIQRDTWRKELADAAQFARPLAASALLTPQSMPAALCRSPVSWILAPTRAGARYPFLAHAQIAFEKGKTTLWRLDRSAASTADALGCDAPSRSVAELR